MIRLALILCGFWAGQIFAASAPLFVEIFDASLDPPPRMVATYPVQVNFAPLDSNAPSISLALPGSDDQVEIVRTRFEPRPIKGYHWIGKADDVDVVLTVDGPRVTGFIRTGHETYVVNSNRSAGTFQHSLNLVDSNSLPPDLVLGEASLQSLADSPSKAGNPDLPQAQCFGAADEPIDVLVVYSPEAFSQADDDLDLLRNRLENSEAKANTTLVESNVSARINIVAVEPAPASLIEEGTTIDLVHARENEQLRAMRRQHRADVVVYLVGGGLDNGQGYCGLTRAQRRAGDKFFGMGYDFYDSAVLVLVHDCMVLENDLSHEIGHIVGLDHNPQNSAGSQSTNIFPFAFGHYVSPHFRDDMSSRAPCPNDCPRKMFFSDPTMLSHGYPRGTASRNNAETYRRMYRCTNTLADYVFIDNFESPVEDPVGKQEDD